MPADAKLLDARGLAKHYTMRGGGLLRAVDGVDLAVRGGETHALVGESGCGKTTLGRLILRPVEPTAGSIRFRGEDLLALRPEVMRRMRPPLSVIFQDPCGSLDPRMTGATTPSALRPASKVAVLQWPCGTAVTTRAPRGRRG